MTKEDEQTPVVLTYRVTRERRKELKKWAAEHDTSVQAIVERALDFLLNPASDSPAIGPETGEGKIKKALRIRNHLMHTGQDPRFGDWALAVINSDIEWVAMNLALIIQGHIGSLELAQRTGELHARGHDTPDYAALLDDCKNAVEQLGRYFEARRKKARGTTEGPDPQGNED